MLVLSHALVFESRFARAEKLATNARERFLRHNDASALAEISGLLSYVHSARGSNDRAARLAHECATHAAACARPIWTSFAHNYSGVSRMWARDYATSSGLLNAAAAYANSCSCAFHPLVNASFGEALRLAVGDAHGDLSALARTIARARALERRGRRGTLPLGNAHVGRILLAFAECFLAARSGDKDEASVCNATVAALSRDVPRRSWLHAFTCWARLECQLAHGLNDKARRSAREMWRASQVGEHAQLQSIAEYLERLLPAGGAPFNTKVRQG